MSRYPLPQRKVFSETGKTRRVGYEIEFAGLGLIEVANLVADAVDGAVEKETEAECTVSSGLGEFGVELDWQLGKNMARDRREARLEEVGVDDADDPLMEWITTTAAQIAPIEIVCPPIPMDELDQLDPIIDGLRSAGARGTAASPVYAFGVHINPELPDLETGTVAKYILAFSLCQDWLVKANDVDLARRITPYINLFPDEYIRKLIEQQDATLKEIIECYLKHNPTRNRALDMTPLFRHLDEDLLTTHLDDERIKARPTFHYRLPNSTPEKTGWSLSESWRTWCVVEALAGNQSQLQAITDQWLEYKSHTLNLGDPPWFSDLDNLHANL